MAYNVDHDISQLVDHIKRLGKQNATTQEIEVCFKVLFDDTEVANSLESLAGTLKAAKKKKLVSYQSELLLQGVSDNEVITLKKQVEEKKKD